MKLLGLRLCQHDSNISYFDGEQVHYIKTERLRREKHHAYLNLYEWESDIKNIWNITPKDVDQIGIVLDPWHYGLPPDIQPIFPHINYSILPKNLPLLRVDHHLAHAKSSWPILKSKPDVEIIIDGFGEDNITWTILKNDKIVDQGLVDQNGSLGMEMDEVGEHFDLDGLVYDRAGKIMGLQTYGKIDYEFLSLIQSYDMFNINKLFNIELWLQHKKDKILAKLTLLDWIHTIHFRVGEILVDFFSKYCSPSDVISYTGGVAQNVIWNSKIKSKFPNLIVTPHCNDEGLSLGIIEYLRQINNLPQFKTINFPYIGYQKKQDLYEPIRRRL